MSVNIASCQYLYAKPVLGYVSNCGCKINKYNM